MPWPKAMCGFGSRVMSKRSGSRKCFGSRLAEPIIGSTRLPRGIVWPAARRRAWACACSHCTGERKRSTSSIAEGSSSDPLAEQRELVWMVEQANDRVVDQVGGRLLAADEQQLKEAQDVVVRQLLAVDLGLRRAG